MCIGDRIISNLFTNAIKYSETYIHVRLWMEDTCWFLSEGIVTAAIALTLVDNVIVTSL